MTSYSPSTTPRKLTNYPHLNLYATDVQAQQGASPWIFASRKEIPGVRSGVADAAVIVAIVKGAGGSRLVITREYRAPLGCHEISLPSGLIDAGETATEAARREMREETGLELTRIVHVSPPVASSAGLTDETVSLVFAEAIGEISKKNQTEHEDIETRLITVEEIRELLRQRTSDIISSRLYPILITCVTSGSISAPEGL